MAAAGVISEILHALDEASGSDAYKDFAEEEDDEDQEDEIDARSARSLQ